MRFWLSLVTNTEPEQLPAIARHAEEVGFHGVTVPDHLVMSTRIESKYPYTEDGRIWWPDDMPWLDPWVALSAIGGATSPHQSCDQHLLGGAARPVHAGQGRVERCGNRARPRGVRCFGRLDPRGVPARAASTSPRAAAGWMS